MNDEYLADSNKDSDFFMVKQNPELIDRKVIEDIKAEIESCRGKFYQNEDNTYSPYMDETLDRVLEVIERHCGGDKE